MPNHFHVMSFFVRGLARIAAGGGILVLLLCVASAAAVWLTVPANDLAVRVPGIDGLISVSLDGDGVPRIRAASELDAATALGFLHARERLFQMDLMRRAASGQLSEIAGHVTLRLDRMMRTLGLRRHAVEDLASLPTDTVRMLEAYARGVNAWIELKGRFAAPEFLVLGTPEPWKPEDSLLWAKTMGLWLSMNWRQELGRLALSGQLPPGRLDELWPPQGSVPSVESRVTPDLLSRAARLAAALPAFPEPYALPQRASNEWAVDGRHTSTGKPLLAGDPHLAFNFPGIWYLARIEIPQRVLAGATAPGVPFLVLGHNGKIAWTFTTTGADVQDIFIETPVGSDAYQTPDGPRRFMVREERVKVRGEADQRLVVRETRHGPVISDLDSPDGPILAVAMGNLQPGDTAAAGLLALNRAATVNEAGNAAAMISSPVQNLLVADQDTIGLFVTGRVPLRKQGDGSAPVPGNGSYDWTGWADGPRLPHVVAPASGRLVNANEPLVTEAPHAFMGRDGFGPWRADRVRQMLDASDQHTVASFATMQTDNLNLFAVEMIKRLKNLTVDPGMPAAALNLVRNWDGRASALGPEPLIFNAWMQAFYDAVIKSAGLRTGLGTPAADFIAFVMSPAGRDWCSGDCSILLRNSLTTAVASLSQRFGDEPSRWRWGDAHVAAFSHPLLRNQAWLESIARISIPVDGDDDTVGRGGINAMFEAVHGASFRGVYDLADLDRSVFMMAPGQSGHILSGHARDFLQRWRNGATITLGPLPAYEQGQVRLIP